MSADMGDTARRIHAEQQLRQQYDYLFAHEREQFENRVRHLEHSLAEKVSAEVDLRSQVARLQTLLNYNEQKSTRRRASRPSGRVRCIYWVTARIGGDAQALGDYLWIERPKLNDEPESGMKVATYAAEGETLKLVIDYTVTGNSGSDVRRMLEKAAARTGMTVEDFDYIEKSRVEAPAFGAESATG